LILYGTAQVELQNRVHQFNSGRGLHQQYQIVAADFLLQK
jgi:hypothetical protein